MSINPHHPPSKALFALSLTALRSKGTIRGAIFELSVKTGRRRAYGKPWGLA